jgi:hypothetical protein
VIARQKNVLKSQILRQLSFPDAVVVVHSFGVYLADDVQEV